MVHLLRASAGAGKTHRLVQNYLESLLPHPEKIEQIVVVSFTNKATQELKERILARLFELSNHQDSPLAEHLKAFLGYDTGQLATQARKVLHYLLHHYHQFRVCTLDRFFQQWLRAFSYEVAIPNTYQLALEQEQLVDRCLCELIQQLPNRPNMQEALMALATKKVEQGKSWSVTQEMKRWTEEILQNLFQESSLPPYPSDLDDSFDLLVQEKEKFEKQLQQLATTLLDHVAQQGLRDDDFKWGKSGVLGFLRKLKKGKDVPRPSSRILKAVQDRKSWVREKSPQYERALSLVESSLQPLLAKIIQLYDQEYRYYATITALLPFRYLVATQERLRVILEAYTQRHNSILIQTLPQRLEQILQHTSPSFLASKVGTLPRYLLIDEFQDLSTDQWQAIAPLIKRKMVEHSCFVGDVKQAIYRWRGGNPQLLLSQVADEIPATQIEDLPYNFRSLPTIVAFNNQFFAQAAERLTGELNRSIPFAQNKNIAKAYAHVQQKMPPGKGRDEASAGYVSLSLIQREELVHPWQEESLVRTVAQIETLQKRGYQPSDITLLVRNHMEAQRMLSVLADRQASEQALPGVSYQALTPTALCLADHRVVQLLIHCLYYLKDPENIPALAAVVHLYQYEVAGCRESVSDYLLHLDNRELLSPYLPKNFFSTLPRIGQLPLYPLIIELVALFEVEKKAIATPYLNAFKERVHAFSLEADHHLFDFLDWWEKYGKKEVAPMPEASDAMQVMTIHQAKGLAFEVVLLPFCSWELDHVAQKSPILWAHTDEKGVGHLPRLPLLYRKELAQSYYAEDYLEERWQQYLEQLNLFYVACTRAQKELYIYAPLITTPAIHTVAALLSHIVPEGVSEPLLPTARWDSEAHLWQAGRPHTPHAHREKRSRSVQERVYLSSPVQHQKVVERLQVVFPRGQWWHQLLSDITTVESLPEQLQHYVRRQELTPKKAQAIQEKLERIFKNPLLSEWFSDRWTLYRERTIVLPSGELWRPDRVMIQGEKAVVLDFKLGRPGAAHQEQVMHYMKLLTQMGYLQVKGFLLYLDLEKLIEVVFTS